MAIAKKKIIEPLKEFDIIKGMCIIVVIFDHLFFYKAWTFSIYPLGVNLIYTGLKFLSIAIPLFLFLAGFHAAKLALRNPKYFVKSRLKNILIPYTIWAGLWYVGYFFFGDMLGQQLTLPKAVFWYFTAKMDVAYYFIFVLIIFYILTPLLAKVSIEKYPKLLKWLFLCMIFFSALYFLPLYWNKDFLNYELCLRNPLNWMFYFAYGIYASKLAENRKNEWEDKIKGKKIFWSIIIYMISMIGFYFIPDKFYNFAPMLDPLNQVFCVISLPIFMRIGFLISRKRNRFTELIASFGRHSFGIYLASDYFYALIVGVGILIYPPLMNQSEWWLNIIFFFISAFLQINLLKLVWKHNKKVYKYMF